MTMPSEDERPAKQWPPLRTASGSRARRANAIASATSCGLVQRTIACGRMLSNWPIAGLLSRS